jgi:hypothetical protein
MGRRAILFPGRTAKQGRESREETTKDMHLVRTQNGALLSRRDRGITATRRGLNGQSATIATRGIWPRPQGRGQNGCKGYLTVKLHCWVNRGCVQTRAMEPQSHAQAVKAPTQRRGLPPRSHRLPEVPPKTSSVRDSLCRRPLIPDMH